MRKKVYEIVAERDDYLCRVCGRKANDVHHIIFRSHGGKDEPDNLICLCRQCHEAAHADERVWRDTFQTMLKEGDEWSGT